jgi:hypothetical protein
MVTSAQGGLNLRPAGLRREQKCFVLACKKTSSPVFLSEICIFSGADNMQ